MAGSCTFVLYILSTTCIFMFDLAWYWISITEVNSKKTIGVNVMEAAKMMDLDLVSLTGKTNVEIVSIIVNIIPTLYAVRLPQPFYWPQFQWFFTGFTLVKWWIWIAVNIRRIVCITLLDCVLSRDTNRWLVITIVTSINKTICLIC